MPIYSLKRIFISENVSTAMPRIMGVEGSILSTRSIDPRLEKHVTGSSRGITDLSNETNITEASRTNSR
jgi:hypothetical protein